MSLSEKFTLERNLFYAIIVAVVITLGFIVFLFIGQVTKSIKITSPIGGEEWATTQSYKITWKAKGVDKVGIVLFKGSQPKWIAKNITASLGSYDWKIYPGQEYGDDYWISVFEYPWQKGNTIDFSDGSLAVVFPELSTCETLSIQQGYPYVPSDMPNLRKVFITETRYNGNLGGLEGADAKCQAESQRLGFNGSYQAFIGGDTNAEMAVARLDSTARKSNGVFIEAVPSATLIRGNTCNRLLGKDFNDFKAKLSGLVIVDKEKLQDSFLQKLSSVWLGRMDDKSKQSCIPINAVENNLYIALAERYSSTSTCQNWTRDSKYVEGYPIRAGVVKPQFPNCYTPQGKFTDSVASAALSTGQTGGTDAVNSISAYIGKTCDTEQFLLCIEK